MTDVWTQAAAAQAVTYDMTGEDYAYRPADEDARGLRGHIACWNSRHPQGGDYLILRNGTGSSRYRVVDVDLCMNVDPPTMWMANLEFAPRQLRGETSASLSETGRGATDA